MQGKYKPEILEGLRNKIKDLNQAKKDVISKHAGLTAKMFDAWVEGRKEDETIKHYLKELEGIAEDVFVHE